MPSTYAQLTSAKSTADMMNLLSQDGFHPNLETHNKIIGAMGNDPTRRRFFIEKLEEAGAFAPNGDKSPKIKSEILRDPDLMAAAIEAFLKEIPETPKSAGISLEELLEMRRKVSVANNPSPGSQGSGVMGTVTDSYDRLRRGHGISEVGMNLGVNMLSEMLVNPPKLPHPHMPHGKRGWVKATAITGGVVAAGAALVYPTTKAFVPFVKGWDKGRQREFVKAVIHEVYSSMDQLNRTLAEVLSSSRIKAEVLLLTEDGMLNAKGNKGMKDKVDNIYADLIDICRLEFESNDEFRKAASELPVKKFPDDIIERVLEVWSLTPEDGEGFKVSNAIPDALSKDNLTRVAEETVDVTGSAAIAVSAAAGNAVRNTNTGMRRLGRKVRDSNPLKAKEYDWTNTDWD